MGDVPKHIRRDDLDFEVAEKIERAIREKHPDMKIMAMTYLAHHESVR